MRRWQKAVIWAVVVGFAGGGIGLFTFQRLSPPEKGSPEEVVLSVEGQEFTRAQFSRTLENLFNYLRQLYQRFGLDFEALLRGTDGAFRRFQYQAQAGETLVRQVIIRNEAGRLRIHIPEAELDQAVQTRYSQILQELGGDENLLRLHLQRYNLTIEQYKNLLRQPEEERLREEKLKAAVVGAIEPTDEELTQYLEANKAAYQTEPEKVKVAHILVKEASLAAELLAKAQAPDADFAALAKQYSQDEATKEKGGETDYFSRYESPFSPTVTDVIWPLAVGEVRLVRDDKGYHIVKLLERKPPVVPPLSEIRTKVRADYVQRETAERWDKWYKDKRDKASIDARDPVLAAAMVYTADKEAALTKLLRAQEEGHFDNYLPYYIGRIYEELYTELGRKRAELERKETRTPDEETELAELRSREAELKSKALAQYLRFMETGEGDETFFNRVLRLDPNNVQALFQLAEHYRLAGNNVGAEAQYARVLEIDPNFVAGWVGRGDNAMAIKLYSRATEFYGKALELQPGNTAVSLKLADAYIRNKQYDQARPILDKILKADPHNVTALLLLGDLLMAQGKLEEAVNTYTKAWQRSPTAEVQLKLAQALAAAGQTEEAMRRFQDLIHRSPYNAQARLGYADLLLARGKPDQALAEYRNALRFAADVETKEKAARKIVELRPDDIATRMRLASYLREQYKYDGAIAQYEAVIERDPKNLDAIIGLGDCYVPKTQYDKALSYYKQALELAPTSEKKIEIYGKIIHSEEQRAGAKPLGLEGLEALWQRALLYKELGRPNEAIADLKRIQNIDPNFRADEVQALLAELEKPQPL